MGDLTLGSIIDSEQKICSTEEPTASSWHLWSATRSKEDALHLSAGRTSAKRGQVPGQNKPERVEQSGEHACSLSLRVINKKSVTKREHENLQILRNQTKHFYVIFGSNRKSQEKSESSDT